MMAWMKVAAGCVLILASWYILRGEQIIYGDGVEYVLQTQALALRGQVRIDCAEARDYWNRTNPYGVILDPPKAPRSGLVESAQAGGRWGGLYPDHSGNYRFYHFWAYSLAVVPFYFVLHHLGGAPLEYDAFRFLNWILILGPFVAVWTRRRSWVLLAIGLLTLFTPLVPYADWQHPELFCFSLVFFSFWLAASPRWFWLSPLLLGIATAQNIPIGLAFPLHLFYLFREHKVAIRKSVLRLALAYGAALLLAVSSLLYSAWFFGCFNVIAGLGLADMSFASLGRMCDVFFSPAVGAIWLYPPLFLFLPLMVRKKEVLLVLLAVVTAAGMAYLSSATRNFNAGQVGSLRYAVWILSPLWYFLLSGTPPQQGAWKRRGIIALMTLMACNVAVIATFKYDRLVRKDIRQMAVARRGVPEVAALYSLLHYNDDVEILVETIVGKELASKTQFNGVYIWTLGPTSSLVVIAERAGDQPEAVEWKSSEPFSCRTIPSGNHLFRFTNGMARLEIPPGARYRSHPYWGNYILIWLDMAVDAPQGLAEQHFRDSRKNK